MPISEVSKTCMDYIIQYYVCNGDYTNCKYERANLPCSLLCNCKYNNTIGITNVLATSNALINKHSVRNTQLRVFMH